jgi:hypothetical protein
MQRLFKRITQQRSSAPCELFRPFVRCLCDAASRFRSGETAKAAAAAGALALCTLPLAAVAQVPQGPYSQPGPYAQQGGYAQQQGGAAVSPACGRLEAQLAAIDRGAGADPARADQARRLDDTLAKQQTDLDRTQSTWQRLGCQAPSLFSIFSNQSPQCGPLNGQIQQMRANIDRTTADLQRTRHGGDDEMQRQAVIGALAQNSCGPQYRAAAAPQRGFFETIFGGPSPSAPPPGPGDFPQIGGGGGYRTLCVRSCDGFYFPISYSTSPSHFAEDEQTCHQQCPAAEVTLYSHRNPGEEVAQAVSTAGRTYRELANAFRYRREMVPACGCRGAGQTWADALGQTKDQTVERGDIVVTEEKAKALSQPRAEPPPRGQQRAEARKPSGNMPAIAPSDGNDPSARAADGADGDPTKRVVRPVGPTFISPR